MLDGENQTTYFDMARDDEMDDLRDGSIQTLSATMDDAEEQHERQISQISKRVSSKQIADLQERAQRARQLEGQEGRRPSVQSMMTAKSNDSEDLPPLEGITTERMTAEAASKEYVKGLVNRQFKDVAKKVASSREQKMDSADSSSSVPAEPSRRIKETIDYSTDMKHWKQTTNVQEEDLLFQLHLRGMFTEEQEKEYNKKKKKGRGRGETGRAYLLRLVEEQIDSGKWTAEVNDELLRKRMGDWRVMKGKGKASEV